VKTPTNGSLFGLAPDGGYGDVKYYHNDALEVYSRWDSPDVIVSDGAYSVSGFPGDPASSVDLPQ